MADFKSIATQLIKKFGAPCKLTQNGSSPIAGSAVFLNRQEDDERDTHIAVKTNTVYFTSTKVAPLAGDVLEFNRKTYLVTAVEQFNPNDLSNIVWKMEVST